MYEPKTTSEFLTDAALNESAKFHGKAVVFCELNDFLRHEGYAEIGREGARLIFHELIEKLMKPEGRNFGYDTFE